MNDTTTSDQPDPAERRRLIEEARDLLDRIVGPEPETFAARLLPVTCDDCEAGTPGHNLDDPKLGGLVHEHRIASGDEWEVRTSWFESRRDQLEPGMRIYDEHAVYIAGGRAPEMFTDPDEAQAFGMAILKAAALQRLAMAWWTDERAAS